MPARLRKEEIVTLRVPSENGESHKSGGRVLGVRRNDRGGRAATGIYVCRMRSGEHPGHCQMLIGQ